MRRAITTKLLPRFAILLALSAASAVIASEADHREFEATLHAPYTGAGVQDGRTFTLQFEYPHVATAQDVVWRLEIVAPSGEVVQRWHGVEALSKKAVKVPVRWAGRDDSRAMRDGVYQVRLAAVSQDAAIKGKVTEAQVDAMLAAGGDERVDQEWDIAVGQLDAPAMPAFEPLPAPSIKAAKPDAKSAQVNGLAAPAPASLPYTVYFGNLHSQSNHSDGGGALSTCVGAQNPQSGTAGGPTEAYTYAMNKGLDILMTSEHNHMYDGSDNTNASADPAVAKALYQSGLSAAANFNAAHPNFLGVYGLEWGVITNGGHMNIFNTNELLGWEYNSSNQLIADTFTAKNDYAGLFTLMRQRGWIGQFNHPSTSGQFLVNGVAFGYTADGDQAMAMCEVLNTSAFSTNTTETETSNSTYEGACKKALEAGYHVAFTTDQDNHCANWGASFTNRTGVLIPNGTPLSQASFIAALQARRVFATMDKGSQLVLTANGHIMGERFTNSGSLNLVANYASSGGKTVTSVLMYEGVPGRNGTVTQLSSTANTTITPANGEHFYYAKVTQNDGNILWSAPIWVTQSSSSDTVAPTVSSSETGSSGTITLSANASDNVGVTNVEFYVDGVLKGADNTSPYSMTLNSTTLANGSHSLVAKAYDAASNVGTSGTTTFSVSNGTADTTAPTVSASESGSSGTITLSATASDNVGVTNVEFYVDGVLKGADNTSPYSMTLNSTTLTNGSHSLTAKAYDAAGNVATSSAASFSVNNAATQLIVNGGFESGATSWTASSGVITSDATQPAHGGTWKAWLDGYGAVHTDTAYQQVAIPSTATSVSLSFWLQVVSSETTTTSAYDTLKVQVRNSSGTVLATLATYSNLNKGASYVQKTFDLSAYKGQTVQIYFEGTEDSTLDTSFIIDDVSLTAQ
ncbi:Ig-like domain-containing protein [Massilia sp. R2A-15]|uniref:Ig-like domain-containing protein n=1 Tax=Massilia sp. R2A-15 TaxID=3064278 RepID=UPI002734C63A|nr:Ig-like domain-containing protein [Massilia sp. R2A-15]WLI89357.1 Ig-like domain-containing protein [Massilia sp. R2A-15]